MKYRPAFNVVPEPIYKLLALNLDIEKCGSAIAALTNLLARDYIAADREITERLHSEILELQEDHEDLEDARTELMARIEFAKIAEIGEPAE